jgi:2-polyprenyl-6-methoxyphenol hydroxylase-like FAD-dependent oxidoreductase
MENLALELAQSMNVSVSDVMALAQSVANSIELDNVKPDQVSTELVEAYVPHAVKKFNSFHSTYLTNPEARLTFQSNILADLTN